MSVGLAVELAIGIIGRVLLATFCVLFDSAGFATAGLFCVPVLAAIAAAVSVAFATSELVVEQLIDWYEEEFSQDLTDEQREELSKRIIETYEGINPENW